MSDEKEVPIIDNHSSGRVRLLPCTGTEMLPGGDVKLKIQAVKGARVTAAIGNTEDAAVEVVLTDLDQDGIYETIFCPNGLVGPQKLVFRVNDNITLNPKAPMWYHANMLSNYIEFPDPETDALIRARKDIPHGAITHEFYYSAVYEEFVSSIVYTPPGYCEGMECPVLYLFHEVAENKTAWTDASKMNYLLDNLIADGKCVPMIVVENDCTTRLDYHEREDWFEGYAELERFISEDCIPYVERKYHTGSGKWERAIAGFGLGAVQAGYIGLRNTGVFGNIGLFTAFWVTATFHDEGKEDPFYTAVKAIGEHPGELNVFYRSEGDLDPHYNGIASENALISRLGADRLPGYVCKVYHGSHTWGSYRRSLRDFLPLLFQKA